MSDINIDVAASGISLRDRDSARLHRSPTLPTNHHSEIETTLSHDFKRMATIPDPAVGTGEAQ
jgi:hypothetical protein